MDYSQFLHVYWKSPLYIENRDDPTSTILQSLAGSASKCNCTRPTLPVDIYIFLCWWQDEFFQISSSSSCCAASTDIPYPLSLRFPIIHRLWQVFRFTSRSCCMYVRAGRPAFDWPYAGVHRSTSLTISSLLFQKCPECLVRLACIVFVIGGRWPYSWRLVRCSCYDLFNIARNILE